MKSYSKKVLAHVEKNHPDDLPAFKKQSMAFVQHLVKNFDDCEFYLNEKSADHPVSTLGIGFWDSDCVEGPRFYFLKHGLEKQKC